MAIRLVYEKQSPPEHLHGRRLTHLHRAIYASKGIIDKFKRDSTDTTTPWIVKEEDGPLPGWATQSYPTSQHTVYVVSDLLTEITATREGLGASILPCYIGDRDTELMRLHPDQSRNYGELWILTHGDIRDTPRVRAFTEFMATAIRTHANLLEGRGD